MAKSAKIKKPGKAKSSKTASSTSRSTAGKATLKPAPKPGGIAVVKPGMQIKPGKAPKPPQVLTKQLSNGMKMKTFGSSVNLMRPFAGMNRPFRILSIDGGGARGMIPATILKEIERRTGKRIHEIFDRVVGTSTGSILTCGLTKPDGQSRRSRYSAEEIVQIYRDLGEVIFSRGSFQDRVIDPANELMGRSNSWIATNPGKVIDTVSSIYNTLTNPLHNVHKLAYHLHDKLGDTRMRGALCEAFVYAYDIGSRTNEVMGSVESSLPGSRDYSNYRMWQAATASSAAVPFFSPYRVYANGAPPQEIGVPGLVTNYFTPSADGDFFDLVDGGNAGVGNPTLLGYLEESNASRDKNTVVLSLGTGHYSEPIPDASTGWGFVEWGIGGDLLGIVFDGATDHADMVMRSKAGPDLNYFRWQPALPPSLAFLDEGSRSDMDALEDVARTFIAAYDEEIDELIEQVNFESLVSLAS